MRRMAALFGLMAALALVPGVALAARPVGRLPNRFVRLHAGGPADVVGPHGRGVRGRRVDVYVGGVPANGFTAEFDSFAADAGFGSGQGLYDFVWVTQWDAIDKNDRPHGLHEGSSAYAGNPALFFNGVDNTSR